MLKKLEPTQFSPKRLNKPILQFDENMNFIKEWESCKTASEELGINSNILGYYARAVNGSHKYKDFIFIYKVLYKQSELLETPEKDNQQPSLNRNILEGSTTSNRILTYKDEDSKITKSALQHKNVEDIV